MTPVTSFNHALAGRIAQALAEAPDEMLQVETTRRNINVQRWLLEHAKRLMGKESFSAAEWTSRVDKALRDSATADSIALQVKAMAYYQQVLELKAKLKEARRRKS